MVRKIYGSVHSAAMMRALAALHEKGLEFQFVPVDMRAGEHKKDPFHALNPFGQVPAFEDGDLKLFESRAITQYIARKYPDMGTPLILESKPTVKVSASMEFKVHPETMESNMQWELMPDRAADAAVIENMMATVNMWTEVEAHQFDPVASRLQRELVYRQMIGVAPETAVFGENWTKLTELLDIYEAQLSQSKYLGCDFFTLADLHHLPALTNLMGTPARTMFDARPQGERMGGQPHGPAGMGQGSCLEEPVLKQRV